MALKNVGTGAMVDLLILNPANSTSSFEKWNFFGFNMIPFLPHSSKYCAVCVKLSSVVFDQSRVSSTHLTYRFTSAMMLSYLDVYASPDAMYP